MNYKIKYNEHAVDPRSCDNTTKMVCFHKRYDLGDDLGYKSLDYNSWDELKKQLHKDYDIAIIEPLYMYDHSGVSLSTTPFGCRWDSFQIGFIFIERKVLYENYNCNRITSRIKMLGKLALENELNTYGSYLNGEVYIIVDEDGEFAEGDYYGLEEAENRIKELEVELQY